VCECVIPRRGARQPDHRASVQCRHQRLHLSHSHTHTHTLTHTLTPSRSHTLTHTHTHTRTHTHTHAHTDAWVRLAPARLPTERPVSPSAPPPDRATPEQDRVRTRVRILPTTLRRCLPYRPTHYPYPNAVPERPVSPSAPPPIESAVCVREQCVCERGVCERGVCV
jgi:hypothetical protein